MFHHCRLPFQSAPSVCVCGRNPLVRIMASGSSCTLSSCWLCMCVRAHVRMCTLKCACHLLGQVLIECLVPRSQHTVSLIKSRSCSTAFSSSYIFTKSSFSATFTSHDFILSHHPSSSVPTSHERFGRPRSAFCCQKWDHSQMKNIMHSEGQWCFWKMYCETNSFLSLAHVFTLKSSLWIINVTLSFTVLHEIFTKTCK